METSTTSMAAAAYAMAKGQKLPRLEQDGNDHFKMFFDDPTGEVSRLIVEYFNEEPISGCVFYRSLCNLRGAMNRAKKNGGAI